MRNVGLVTGSAEQAKPLVIGKDTVYVHSNIVPATRKTMRDGELVDELCDGLYTYEETQYDKDEYLMLVIEEKNRLAAEITDTQLALCELYETLGGAE